MSAHFPNRKLSVFASVLLVVVAQTNAQSITVLSGGDDAKGCSQAAEWTAMNMGTSQHDIDTCTRALEFGVLSPRDRAATLVNRGIVLVGNENYQQALADYNKAMQVQPELPEAYVSRGNLLFLANDLDAAISDYDKALDLMLGRSHIAFFNRGLANEKRGMKDAALADYRQSLELRPDFTKAQDKITALTSPTP